MYLDKEKLDRIQEEIYSSGKWAVEKQGDLHISLKEDKSVVTEVDITISHRILALIKSLFPDAAIISEEEITEEKDNPLSWTLSTAQMSIARASLPSASPLEFSTATRNLWEP